jgi:hypothetical protein
MIDIHKRLYSIRYQEKGNNKESTIHRLAMQLLSEAYVICFDEFQVCIHNSRLYSCESDLYFCKIILYKLHIRDIGHRCCGCNVTQRYIYHPL